MNAPWPPRPVELATWPLHWRRRWGELANQYEDAGDAWDVAERKAFERAKAEMQAQTRAAPARKATAGQLGFK